MLSVWIQEDKTSPRQQKHYVTNVQDVYERTLLTFQSHFCASVVQKTDRLSLQHFVLF